MGNNTESSSNSAASNSWSVAVICSVIRFFLSGTRRIGALLYIECIQQFKISRRVASIPFVISFMLIFLTGPLVGYLGGRFQLRSVILTGCVLSSIGIGANFWAEDIVVVTIFWGIFFGSGICLGSSLLPEVLNRRFNKNISSANGITYAGSSVGAAVLPVAARFLIYKYDVCGAFLILGGLTLNTIPAALLIGRDPDSKSYDSEERSERENDFVRKSSAANDVPVQYFDNAEHGILHCRSNSDDCNVTLQPTFERLGCNTNTVEQNLNEHFFDTKSSSTSIKSLLLSSCDVKSDAGYSEQVTKRDSLSSCCYSTLQAGDLRSTRENKLVSVPPEQSFIANSDTSSDVQFVNKSVLKSDPKKKSGCGAFRIFQDSTFIAILITQSFFIGIMAIMNTIIIDYCMDKNITADEGVFILLGLAVTDIAGRLGLGWVSDFELVTVVTFVMICFFGLGLNFLLFVWSDGLLMCMLSSVLFGLITGGIMSHSPAIIKNYIGKEHRTMAVASRYLLFAPLILTMPSFLGYFRDSIGSYDGVMYILVTISMLSGGITYLIPYLARRKLSNAEQTKTEQL